MDRHVLTLMQLGIMEESWPEHLDVFHLQCCKQRLFLIERVVTITIGKDVQEIYFY